MTTTAMATPRPRNSRAHTAALADLHRSTAALAWLTTQLADLHNLAWNPAGSNPDILVQSHTNIDIGNQLGIIAPEHDRHLTPKPNTHANRLIGTPAQQTWHDLANALYRTSRTLDAICEVTLDQPGRTRRPHPLPGTPAGMTHNIRRALRAIRDITHHTDTINAHPDSKHAHRALTHIARLLTATEAAVSKLYAAPDSRPDLDRHHLPAAIAGATTKAAQRRRQRERRPTQLEHGGLDCRCPRCTAT